MDSPQPGSAERPERRPERPAESQGDRAAATGPLPINQENEPCRACRAPIGKPHLKSCALVTGRPVG